MDSDDAPGGTADEAASRELDGPATQGQPNEAKDRARYARYRAAHREELSRRARERRARNRDRDREIRQERRERRTQDELEALRSKQRRWYAENQERIREYTLRYQYGLNNSDYVALLEAQKRVCAICRREERRIDRGKGAPTRLAVDHCHRTGVIRGLLCSACNAALGLMEDSADILQGAIAYLARFESQSREREH